MVKKWIIVVGSGFILGLGMFLRLYGITQVSYWIDESYSIALAQAVTKHGYPLLDSGQTIWRDPLYHYLLAGVIFLEGTGEFSTRLLAVLAGITTCGLLAYIATRWFNSWRVGIITLILMNLSYWEIAWSRQARMYILLQLLFWLTLFLFERWQVGNRRLLPWWISTSIATVLTHRFGALLLFAMGLFLILKRYWKQSFTVLTIYLGSIIASAGSIILLLHYFYHQPWVNYWLHYTQYLFTHQTITLILAGIGLVAALYRSYFKITLWLFGVFMIGLSIFSFAVTLLQYRYLFFIWPAALLFAALGIDQLLLKTKNYGIVILIPLLLWSKEYVVLPATAMVLESDTTNSILPYKSFTPQPDFKSAYTYIKQLQPDYLITPYPTITRLYLQRDDAAALYIDLIGTGTQTQKTREVYTGTPYLDLKTFKLWQKEGRHGIILLDYFSARRIDPNLRSVIETLSRVYESTTGDWSSVRLYKF